MPEALWTAAAALGSEHGVCRIARAVRIDYAALKTKMAKPAQPSMRRGFIELTPAAPFSTSSSGEVVLELSDDSGSKMSVRANGNGAADLISLARAFWSREA